MTHTVRCPSCFRLESWHPEPEGGFRRAVQTEGGGRRPAVHPSLAAWRLLAAARSGGAERVVAACPACDLPLVTESDALPAIAEWTLDNDLGTFTVPMNGPVTGPDGEMTDEALSQLLERRYDERLRLSELELGKSLFTSALLFPLLGLLLTVWVVAVAVVVLFLWSGFAFQMGR